MFKTVLTLFRGSVAAAGEELEDRSALLILDQQMRDAAAAVERSKRSLALAIAGDQQEGRRLDALLARSGAAGGRTRPSRAFRRCAGDHGRRELFPLQPEADDGDAQVCLESRSRDDLAGGGAPLHGEL